MAKPIVITCLKTSINPQPKGKGGVGIRSNPKDSSCPLTSTPLEEAALEEALKENLKCKSKTLQIPRYEITSTMVSEKK